MPNAHDTVDYPMILKEFERKLKNHFKDRWFQVDHEHGNIYVRYDNPQEPEIAVFERYTDDDGAQGFKNPDGTFDEETRQEVYDEWVARIEAL